MPFRLLYPTTSRRINQNFLNNPDFYKQFGIEGHEGLDFFAPMGTEIYACAAGTVYMVHQGANDHNYGIHVRIMHEHEDGVFKTVYAHFQTALVKEGDVVEAGQVIGLADSTGNSTGSHLHLTLKKDGATALGESTYISKDGRRIVLPSDIIDPTPFLDPQPASIPSRPVLANHPSSELLGGLPYNPPGGKRVVAVPEKAGVGGGGEGLVLEFVENGETKTYNISNYTLKIRMPTPPPSPDSNLLQSSEDGESHTLKVNDVLSVIINGSIPWAEPEKPEEPQKPEPPVVSTTVRMRVTSTIGINVRRESKIANNILVRLPVDYEIIVKTEFFDDGTYIWRQIIGSVFYQSINLNGAWVAEKQTKGDPIYLRIF